MQLMFAERFGTVLQKQLPYLRHALNDFTFCAIEDIGHEMLWCLYVTRESIIAHYFIVGQINFIRCPCVYL